MIVCVGLDVADREGQAVEHRVISTGDGDEVARCGGCFGVGDVHVVHAEFRLVFPGFHVAARGWSYETSSRCSAGSVNIGVGWGFDPCSSVECGSGESLNVAGVDHARSPRRLEHGSD